MQEPPTPPTPSLQPLSWPQWLRPVTSDTENAPANVDEGSVITELEENGRGGTAQGAGGCSGLGLASRSGATRDEGLALHGSETMAPPARVNAEVYEAQKQTLHPSGLCSAPDTSAGRI